MHEDKVSDATIVLEMTNCVIDALKECIGEGNANTLEYTFYKRALTSALEYFEEKEKEHAMD